ncbi:MAG: hypothetical protein B7Y35_10285 [Sphingomonadales bacterium 28-64-96]|nr:MAG: hypothetical protein B7Y35_10285 [Sphingomonadales bacterium 28-64-96]
MITLPVLSQPHVRVELTAFLSELELDDPMAIWEYERQRGKVSGIDPVFHFFFDDHDFDSSAVGRMLFNQAEVQSVESVKLSLEAILEVVGDAEDNDFVSHPLWANVRRTAAAASGLLKQKA